METEKENLKSECLQTDKAKNLGVYNWNHLNFILEKLSIDEDSDISSIIPPVVNKQLDSGIEEIYKLLEDRINNFSSLPKIQREKWKHKLQLWQDFIDTVNYIKSS